MPADKRRKMVVARMFPDKVTMLHELCAFYSSKQNKLLSASEVLNQLVESDYKRRIKKNGASHRSAAAR